MIKIKKIIIKDIIIKIIIKEIEIIIKMFIIAIKYLNKY